MGFGTIALNGVLNPVEEERVPQKCEQLSFDDARDIRLEVEEIEMGLVIDFLAWRSGHLVQLFDGVRREMRKGERIR